MKKLSRLLIFLLCLTACAAVEVPPKTQIETCVGALLQSWQNKDERAFMAQISHDYPRRAALENTLSDAFMTRDDIRIGNAIISDIIYKGGVWTATVRFDISYDRQIDEQKPFQTVRKKAAYRVFFKSENQKAVVIRFDKIN